MDSFKLENHAAKVGIKAYGYWCEDSAAWSKCSSEYYWKTFKIEPKSDKNDAPEGPWTSFLVPWGRLDLLFGFLRVPCGPRCPQGGFIEDFGGHFGGHLETKIDQFWCWFLMCFRDGFLIGLRVVLGMFWEIFWCQNDDQTAKEGFVEIVVLRKQYCCFRGLWAPFGVPKWEKNRVGFRSGWKVGFMMILGLFWESFWYQKTMKRVLTIRWIFKGFQGRP